MNLYSMTNAATELYNLLTNGEIDEQTFNDTLASMGTEEKLESYCKVIRQLEADAEACKVEKDYIAKKQKTAENAVARMKGVIADFLHAKDSTKEKAGTFSVSLSESKAVEVIDENKIPAEFLIPQLAKVDKAAIRTKLMAGETVEGCVLKTNEGVRIK